MEEFKIHEQLVEGPKATVYRALDSKKNRVIIKVLQENYSDPDRLARFRREYEISSKIRSDKTANAILYSSYKGSPAIVMEDFGGISLKEFIKEKGSVKNEKNLEHALSIAIEITSALADIHQQNIIHKDINPSNILIEKSKGQIRIIDFGLASELSFEQFEINHLDRLEGTLAYISPEQTGRINRHVDYRTDLYSLGITFYEMLSGTLPFYGNNTREWVHQHIAKEAPLLHETNENILPAISLIVDKLMRKTAEDRYHSCFGLLTDLKSCLELIKKQGNLTDFELGRHDRPSKFQIPQKLYGRDNEIQLLIESFNSIMVGKPTCLLVKGYAGIGKSMLIGEIQRPVAEQNGYFVTGKFEQFKKDVPYEAFIQALTSLLNSIIAESEEKIIIWRNRFLETLKDNAQLIIDIFPELEIILGPQPALVDLPANEAQNRFIITFQNFVRIFINSAHPLVIFFDDLQWADSASLNMIQNLLNESDEGAFLCIGAYRDHEIHEGHPLSVTLDLINKSGVPTIEIELAQLGLDHITSLISETLHCDKEIALPLAELCKVKTNGNPFFINEFLINLYQKKAIHFNDSQGEWQWDIEQIRKTKVTDNVIDLIIERINHLNEKEQGVLKLASCIGYKFNLDVLISVTKDSTKETVNVLSSAITESLILPLEEKYKYVEYSEDISIAYKFFHDKIRQAAYSLLDENAKAQTHYKIGKLLYKRFKDVKIDEEIFNIVGHFNIGINLLSRDEKYLLATLNLQAGKKAKASGALKQAYYYLNIGLSLLSESDWNSHYDLILNLHTNKAEASYLCGIYNEMELLFKNILKFAKTDLDQAGVWEVRNLAFQTKYKQHKVEAETINYLNKIGVSFPKKANYLSLMFNLLKTGLLLKKMDKSKILALPEVENQEIKTAMRIMGVMVYPLYGSDPLLFSLMILKLIRLTLNYGSAPISPLAFMMYGMILNAMLGKIEEGYRFGQLGMNLLNKLNAKKHWAETSVCYNLGVRIWKEPFKNSTNGLIDDYKIALETGDIEFAISSLSSCSNYLFYGGNNLSEIVKLSKKYKRSLSHLPYSEGMRIMDMQLQAIDNFQESVQNPDILKGKYFRESDEFDRKDKNNDSQLANVYLLKILLAYHFGKYDNALIYIKKGRKHLKGVIGILHYAMFLFYESLVLSSVYKELPFYGKIKTKARIQRNLKRLKKWAHHSPSNFQNKHTLLEAELARISGDFNEAAMLFNKSIIKAQREGIIQEEALGNELSGKFWLSKNNKDIGEIFISRAYKLYQLWGAEAKLHEMKKQYSHISATTVVAKTDKATSELSSSSLSLLSIDLETIIDAAKTISGEMVISDLLRKTLKIILEHAGAQKGLLILTDLVNEEMLIEAEGNVNSEGIEINLSNKKISDSYIPTTIVRYVERSEKMVILHNASDEGDFIKDNYLKKNKVKSVIAIPIIKQSKLSGILYLENNLSTNVFTKERVNVLTILCTQLAVSIENARVYNTLEKKVSERTAEVELQKEEIQLKAEQLKLTNEQLEVLNATKDKLFSVIAHDLKNPFNIIIGFSDYLLDEFETKSRGQIRTSLERIYESSVAAHELLKNLLEWSRDQIGGINFTPANVELRSMVEENILLLENTYRSKKIQMNHTIDEHLKVFVDANMINTVFRNILSNAIKFTETGGRIEISVSKNTEKLTEIVVADSGVGISQENLDKLFRLDASFSTKGTANEKGTGLGLILCKDFVEKNGGAISVESELGKGAIFKIKLPSEK